jgi:curved DNA-binding protein CbpA
VSLYETLDLANDPPPSADVIKRAYKKKAKETHPDKGGTAEQFAKVSRAYLVLSDPVRRAQYDQTGETPEITPEFDQSPPTVATTQNWNPWKLA